MPEFRTRPIERDAMLAELRHFVSALRKAGTTEVSMSFGWDSDLWIDEMWKQHVVALDKVTTAIEDSELSGTTRIGQSDIFIECPRAIFTLCHEGDLHISGDDSLVSEVLTRWRDLGYEPYPLGGPDA